MEGATHAIIHFVTADASATAFVLKATNGLGRPLHAGDLVRMQAVSAPRFDREGALGDLELWVGRPSYVQVLGSLESDPRFAMPVTLSRDIQSPTSPDVLLHVEGVVRDQDPGKWITIWDAVGQIRVRSRQTFPMRRGDRIEAIGYPYVAGVDHCLEKALYRRLAPPLRPAAVAGSEPSPLCLAEQILELGGVAVNRHPHVDLRGVITLSREAPPFACLQDSSGGVRLENPRYTSPEASHPGTVVTVSGEVAEGAFVPVVTHATVSRVGFWGTPDPRPLTFEQALTGGEDGRWVEMRGYVRDVTLTNDLVRLDLSTAAGEFQVLSPTAPMLEALKGAMIRVDGVCVALANARHQLTGFQLWASDANCVRVEELAPDDPFAVPLRPLDSLRRFSSLNALGQRVRTSGTVVLHQRGRYLWVQEGSDSLFALSRQPNQLQPGDRIEVVGFLGNEGRRVLLREAMYRRTSTGSDVRPLMLAAAHSMDIDLAGRLARSEGMLLNVANKNGQVRLLIRGQNTAFEGTLDSTEAQDATKLRALEPGSRLQLTGVYDVQSDEYGKPLSFLLHLRSDQDIRMIRPPPWWTPTRLLWALAGVLASGLAVVGWGG